MDRNQHCGTTRLSHPLQCNILMLEHQLGSQQLLVSVPEKTAKMAPCLLLVPHVGDLEEPCVSWLWPGPARHCGHLENKSADESTLSLSICLSNK